MSAQAHIRTKVHMVLADESMFGVLSSSEQIAVALVLDRKDLLDECRWGMMLAAINRLGPEWTEAAYQVQRSEAWERS